MPGATHPAAEDLHAFEEALLRLDRGAARALLEAAGPDRLRTVERLVCAALERIGAGWERGDVALSQVYMSGRICEDLVDEALPPGAPERKAQPRMAVAVLEDHHAMGKRIVYACLRAAGYELTDYGQGVTVEEVLARVRAEGVRLLLVSTLMLPAALRVAELTRRIRAEGLPVKVLVGGAPFLFDERLWQEVGADAMGHNAAEAIALVHRFSGGAS